MLRIWGRRNSSNVQAVMWCVHELGLTYERTDAGHVFGVTDTEAFGQMNPNRTVPVVQDGEDAPLWETGAILRYLASAYGDAPFWPSGLAERAQVDKWAEWSKINIAIAFTAPVFWRVVRTAPEDQDPIAIAQAVQALEKNLLIAERQLQGNAWLCGPDLTLADIQFGHVLYRYFDIDIERRPLPAVERYFDTLMSRDTYRENVAISYEDLRGAVPTKALGQPSTPTA